MYTLKHLIVTYLLIPDITPKSKQVVEDLWYFNKFSENIADRQPSPLVSKVTYQKFLQTNSHMKAGITPITLALFLYDGLRSKPTIGAIFDHETSTMMEDGTKSYRLFWIKILHKVGHIYRS